MAQDLGVFAAQSEDELQPQFNKVLMGYDPHEVEQYLQQMEEKVTRLERDLHAARAEAETARRKSGSIQREAYAEVAAKMAEVIRAADHHADRLRRDAQEEAAHVVSDARREADAIRREAEEERARLHEQAEREVWSTRERVTLVLSNLTTARERVVDGLRDMRGGLLDLAERLDAVMAAPESAGGDGEEARARATMGLEDLLATLEGFDLILPPSLAAAPEDDEDARAAAPEDDEG